MLIDGLELDYLWIIVMFSQLFGLSFWRHPFTAEDLLVSKWSDAKLQHIFIFWVNCSFNANYEQWWC